MASWGNFLENSSNNLFNYGISEMNEDASRLALFSRYSWLKFTAGKEVRRACAESDLAIHNSKTGAQLLIEINGRDSFIPASLFFCG